MPFSSEKIAFFLRKIALFFRKNWLFLWKKLPFASETNYFNILEHWKKFCWKYFYFFTQIIFHDTEFIFPDIPGFPWPHFIFPDIPWHSSFHDTSGHPVQEHMEFDNVSITKPKFLPELSMIQQQEFLFLSNLFKSAAGRFL